MKMSHLTNPLQVACVESFVAPNETPLTLVNEPSALPRKYMAIRPAMSTNDSSMKIDQTLTTDAIKQKMIIEHKKALKRIEQELNDKYFQMWKNEKRRERELKRKLSRRIAKIRFIKRHRPIEEPMLSFRIGSNPNAFTKYKLRMHKKFEKSLRPPRERKIYFPIYLTFAYRQHIPKGGMLFTDQTLSSVLEERSMQTEAPVVFVPASSSRQAIKTLIQKTLDDHKAKVKAERKERTPGFNFMDDCYSNIKDIKLDDFIDFLETLKPQNFVALMMSYITAQSKSEKAAVVCAILESYDCYWNSEANPLKVALITLLIYVLDWILMSCYDSIRDTLGADISAFLPREDQVITLDDEGPIQILSDFFGVDIGEKNIDDSTLKIVGGVATALLVITGGKFTGFNDKTLDKILKRAGKLGNGLKGISNITDFLPKCFEGLMDITGRALGFTYEHRTPEISKFINDILNLKKEAYDLHNSIQYRPWEVMNNKSVLDSMSQKYDELDKQYLNYMKIEKNMSSCRVVFDELKQLVKTIDEFVKTIENSSVCKQEPFMVIFSGKAGIGKSKMIEAVCSEVAKKLKIPATSYPRTTKVKHWDSYAHQSFVIYDDFGQKKDDLDHEDILEIKNPNKTILPMAKIDEKGRLFTSVGLIAATNSVEPTSSATVKCIDALVRRLEIDVEVIDPTFSTFIQEHNCAPGEYRKRNGQEPTIVEDGITKPYFDCVKFSHFAFMLKPSYLCKDKKPEQVTFDQLVDLIVNYHNVYHESFQKSMSVTHNIHGVLVDAEELPHIQRNNNIKLDDIKTFFPPIIDALEMKATTSTVQTEAEEEVESTASTNSRDLNFDYEEYTKESLSTSMMENLKKTFVQKMTNELGQSRVSFDTYISSVVKLDSMQPQEIAAYLNKDAQNSWVTSYRKKNNCNYTAATVAFYDFLFQKDQTVGTSDEETPSCSFDIEKGRVILLTGDPGAGKSTTILGVINSLKLKKIPVHYVHGNDIINYTPQPGVLVVDDFTTSEAAIAAVEQLCIRVADKQDTAIKCLILTANDEILNDYFKFEQSRVRFYRRCKQFVYRFNKKPKNNMFQRRQEYYSTKDLENPDSYHAECVTITNHTKNATYKTVWTMVRDECVALAQETDKIAVEYCDKFIFVKPETVKATIDMSLNKPLIEAFKTLYAKPVVVAEWAINRTLKFNKGAMTAVASLTTMLESMPNKPDFAIENLDCFKHLNSMQIKVPNFPNMLIRCEDLTLYIASQHGTDSLLFCFVDYKDFKIANSLSSINQDVDDPTYIKTIDSQLEQGLKSATDTILQDAVELDNADNFSEEKSDTSEFMDFVKSVPKLSTLGLKWAFTEMQSKLTIFKEDMIKNLNIQTIFENMPRIKNFMAILIFIFKLTLAGFNIYALISGAFKKLDIFNSLMQNAPIEQSKKKSRRHQWCGAGYQINSVKPVYISKHLYDDLVKTVQKTAKHQKFDDCVKTYMHYYGRDDVDPEEFDNFFTNFHETNYDMIPTWASYYDQTREEKVVVSKPEKVQLEDPLMLQFNPFNPKVKVKKPTIEKDKEPKPAESIPTAQLDQSVMDPDVRNFINIGLKHTVTVLHSEDPENKACHGLMLADRLGVTVGHISNSSTKQFYVQQFLTPKSTIHKMKIIKVLPALDLTFFVINDNTFPTYSSIIHHFPKQNCLSKDSLVNTNAVLAIPESENISALCFGVRLLGEQKVFSSTGLRDGISYSSPLRYMTGATVKGPVNTQAGDCGSLLIVNNNISGFRFIGLHNSANEVSGHASFLFQEIIEKIQYACVKDESLPEKKSKRIVNPHHEMEISEVAHEALLGMPIAGVGDLKVNRPVKSQLWTSILRLPDSQSYEPSIMAATDERNNSGQDPFYRSVEKWNHPQPNVKMALLNACAEDVGHWYATEIKKRHHECKILTKTEAINSGKNFNLMPINRKSAAGYPWFKYGKKETFLVNKGNDTTAYYGINLQTERGKKLNASVDWLINCSRNPGTHPAIPFSGWLKDEPLKMKKIYDCNSRSFAGAPFDYTIAYRMYFGTIYGAIHEVRDVMPIQVGINPTSGEWHRMTNRLLSVSDRGFDLDFAGFDSTVPAVFQRAIVKVYNKIAQLNDPNWKLEDDIIRENLHEALFKPLIICPLNNETLILQAPGGQPSGHPGTADDNSMIHLLYIYYAWCEIMLAAGRSDLCTIIAFKKNVQCIIYGDDGAYTVSPELLNFFNFVSVNSVLAKLNIKCTPASKGDTIAESMHLHEFEFLKRSFKKIGKFYHGPLHKKSFEKMLAFNLGPSHHWYRERNRVYIHKPEDLLQTADNACLEAIFHGEEFFNYIRDHCFERLLAYDIDWHVPTYIEMVKTANLLLPISDSS